MARKTPTSEAPASLRLPNMGAEFSIGPPSRAYRSPMSDYAGAGSAVMPSQSADDDDLDGMSDESGDDAGDASDDMADDSGDDGDDGDADGEAGVSDDGAEGEGEG